jgi:hypothetical protein
MGTRGPVGKRSQELMGHRTKAQRQATGTVKASGRVPVPAPDGEWHPIARSWYQSLRKSGQSQFFEPSDWQAARFVAEVMTKNLNAERFSAHLFASVWSAMGELLTTEGARRRARMEIERDGVKPESAGVTAISDYRAALG